MAADSPLKSGPSGDNYNTPIQPVMSDTVADCSETVPLDQMRNLVGTAYGCSVGNSNNWVVPAGKDCTWADCP